MLSSLTQELVNFCKLFLLEATLPESDPRKDKILQEAYRLLEVKLPTGGALGAARRAWQRLKQCASALQERDEE